MRHWGYLIYLAANSPIYTFGLIYQIVNGSISQSGTLNFTIFSENFKGIILYCIDSDGNQFGIEVTIGGFNDRNVRLNFNKASKVISLRQFCGCDICEKTNVQFLVKFKKKVIDTQCRGHSSEQITDVLGTNNRLDIKSDYVVHRTPAIIANKRGRLYIMMGNIGPYLGENNIWTLPQKDQMTMCVEIMLYNDGIIPMLGGNNKIRSLCEWKCPNGFCNNGTCRENQREAPKCDCSLTALNGYYCNRSLTTYHRYSKMTFDKFNKTNGIYIKMSWKQLLPKRYCLMDIVHRNGRRTIWMNDHHLSVDASIISGIDINAINFFSVNVSYGHLTIKVISSIYRELNFSSKEVSRINIGFSEGKSQCESFEGAFDIFSNVFQLEEFLSKAENNTVVVYIAANNYWFIFIALVMLTFVLSINVVICAAYMLCKRQRKNRPSPGNIYQTESIELNDKNETDPYDVDHQPYSTLDYEDLNATNSNDISEIYDYMVLSRNDKRRGLPPIPPEQS